MAFSSNSRLPLWGRRSALTGNDPQAELEALRHHGWRGGLIVPHRAFAHLRLRRADIAASAGLVTALIVTWALVLPAAGEMWGRIFAVWSKWTGLHATVVMVPQHWYGGIRFRLPFLNLPAGAPDPWTWWITLFATIMLLAGSFMLSREHLPWIYLIRFLTILQGTALVYFAFAAARFPHDLASYTVGMLVFGAILIGLVPLILGFTFYLFEFGFVQKVGLTVMTMAHLALFIPLQYMLHAYLLHISILFMPVLYFAFGPFLDVLVFIAFYAWGMSWESSRQRLSA